MENDFNRPKETCFEDAPTNTNSIAQPPNALFLERVEQKINKFSRDLKKEILNKIDSQALLAENHPIKGMTKDTKKNFKKKKLIFGYRGSVEKLTPIMLEIDKEMHLFLDPSFVLVFVSLLTSEDLSQHTTKMHMACMTTVFKGMMDHLKPYCISFNPTTIERSGLFESSNGTPIKANCLYNSTTESLKTQRKMELYFKKLH